MANAQVPTWSSDVARIIYSHCTPCHHPGGIAPVSFMTYQQAAARSASIYLAVTGGEMPPFPADPNYKHYAHENVLLPTEIAAIQQWAVNGSPAGNLRTAPAPPVYNDSTRLSTVDLELQMPGYTVTSNGDVFRNFVIPSGLTDTRYVTAIEVMPGNPNIVHHVVVQMDTSSNPIDPNSILETGSPASKVIYAYVPGTQPYFAPPGTGFRLPAHTRIILQMHYAHGSYGQSDTTRVNFKLTPVPQRQILTKGFLNHLTTLTNGPLSIPANETRTFVEQTTISSNLTFLSALPHMHLLGRNMEVYATTTAPDDTIRFVNIPKWDFHWQYNYIFPNALKIPMGSTLRATAFYDNTTNNPDNPNLPPKDVSVGESTSDEMMGVFFTYLPYQAGDENLIIDKRILPQSGTTFCSGQSVWLKTIEGTGYNYQWFRDGNMINGADSASYIATQSGSYTVFLSLGQNKTVSDPVLVTVNSLPEAAITASDSVILQGGIVTLNASTGNGYAYQWYRDDTLINGAISSTYEAAVPGNYTVEIYDGCYAVSEPVTLTNSIATGFSGLPGNNPINIFPNPNSGEINISTVGQFELRVYNIWGELVLTTNLSGGIRQIEIKEKGIYLMQLTGQNGQTASRRVTIQ